MKLKLTIIGMLGLFFFMGSTSCDKVENPYPPVLNVALDTTFYQGLWSDYQANEWPNFDLLPNDNPSRNALIEDFTGHNCPSCPAAATVAHNLYYADPSRVFVASIHASPSVDGTGTFQDVTSDYPVNFTNTESLALGAYWSSTGASVPGSGFFGNPSGTINRTKLGTEYFYSSGVWSSQVDQVKNSSLGVIIKADVNYYDATKGGYLHTEVEVVDANITNDLGQVVYVMEDSLVAPQNVLNTLTPDYVHHDIMRGTLTGSEWGRNLTEDDKVNNKYRLDYSFALKEQLAVSGSGGYNAQNMHLLIYVYDKTTYEIYQVIKKKIE